MSDILAEILARKREEIAVLRKRHSRAALEELAGVQDAPRGFAAALRAQVEKGPAVVAEIKKASPSRGLIRADTGSGPGAGFDPAWLAGEYERGGATCLSVLTDRDFFQGANEHLQAARAACKLPVIRKDFLVDELQIAETRVLGADCVLLIAAALPCERLARLHAYARGLGMDVLVEVHDARELAQVSTAGLPAPLLLGINNRNLRNFATRLETTLDLLPQLPAGAEVVTESGIKSAADVRRMMDAGVRRFLIGESLMRQPSPGAALRALLAL